MFWYRDLTFRSWLLLLMDYGAIDTSSLASSAYLDDLRYLHTSHFILRRFTMDIFIPSIIPEPDHYLILSYTSHRDTWPHPFSRLGEDVDQSLITLVVFSYILLDFRFNIFHDSRAWQIVDLSVTMLSFWQLARWVLIFCLLFAFRAWVIIVLFIS